MARSLYFAHFLVVSVALEYDYFGGFTDHCICSLSQGLVCTGSYHCHIFGMIHRVGIDSILFSSFSWQWGLSVSGMFGYALDLCDSDDAFQLVFGGGHIAGNVAGIVFID